MSQQELGDPVPPETRDSLASFLEANPESRLELHGERVVVVRPWGDATVNIGLPADPEELISTLNAVFLPPNFTALWHRDSKDLEVIWTVVPAEFDIRRRVFDFHFDGKTFHCEFGDASERLLALARSAEMPAPQTSTQHRNLPSLQAFLHFRSAHPDEVTRNLRPTSFWIRSIEWETTFVTNLIKNLNFYMFSFDRQTPTIFVHELPEFTSSTAARFPEGTFPAIISARQLDPYLLGLWSSALQADDPFRRFVYCYQIIEYAAFYYTKETTAQAITRILASPATVSRARDAAHEIMDIVAGDRMQEEHRFAAVIKALVDPAQVWLDIECQRDYFSSDTQFDGGLVISALIRPEWDLDGFRASWDAKLPEALRTIRNALVHAREARQNAIIAPTVSNHERLRPWLAPIMTTAMQVMQAWDVQV